MRSRYSAYCTLNNAYLNDTVHGAALATISEAIQAHNWVNLSIISSHQGTESDTTGMVEFKASFEDNGALYTMHEISKFEKISGRWYYTEGVINE